MKRRWFRGRSAAGPAEDESVETFELINAELAERLKRQIDSGKSIDTKAGILVGFASAAAQFLAARHPQPLLGGVAFTAYAFAVAFGVWTFSVAAYMDVPDPRSLFERYGLRSKRDALTHLAGTRIAAFEANEKKHKIKASRWRISLAFLAVGLVVSVVAIVQDGGHGRGEGQQQRAGGGGRSSSAQP
jgi:hypothetical protein